MSTTSVPFSLSTTQTAPESEGRLLHNQDILCFSHDWNGDPLSKTHLMRLLARDNKVLWVNSIGYRTPGLNKSDMKRAWKKLASFFTARLREVEPNLFVLNPLALPLYGRFGRWFNQRFLRFQVKHTMRKLRMSKPLNWVFNPAASVIAGKLGEQKVIYYCVDEYSAFSNVPSKHIAELEEQLLKRSDLVIVSADLLYQSKSKINPNTVIVRHGVDFDHFAKALDANTKIPDEIASLPKPVIGFFGLIADWVDVDLMAKVAKHFSYGSLVVLGKSTTDTSVLANMPNVHLLGRKPYSELPNYCKGFDVALNPFRISELTLNANPLKVREYLAAGLQVVSTAIPEVEILGTCRIGRTDGEFIHQIEEALKSPGLHQHISKAIQSESWSARLDEVRRHLATLT